MCRPRCPVERFVDRLKGGGISIVAIHIPQPCTQLLERWSIDSTVFLETLVGPRPELFEGPTSFGHADDRHVQVAAFEHGLQRWEDFLIGQIARGAKED